MIRAWLKWTALTVAVLATPLQAATLEEQNRLLYSSIGANGWAKCAAAQITMSALIARGDPVNRDVVQYNENMGNVLGALRTHMLGIGVQQGQLDQLLRGQAGQIRTGDQAMASLVECINTIGALAQKLK